MNSRHLFMMLFLALFIVTDAGASPRTALVIGNSSYQISPLKNPVNDATDMANTLTRSGFAVSLKINADERTMVTAIREFGRTIKQQGGVGLFYYAGHGIQVRGRNYLIPLGAVIESEGDARFEAVDAGFVLSKMEDAGNDMNIVILDACRNNPFARSFRSSAQGLARMDAPKGSIIAYATAPGELAADGTGRNGIYTKHLIQNINTPQLRLEDVFKNVRRAVVNETGNKQVPWESSSLMGQFYFTQAQPQPSALPAIAQQNTAIDSSYEILFWESIKDSRDPRMFEAYMERYPNGIFVTLAQINMQKYDNPSQPTVPNVDPDPVAVSVPKKEEIVEKDREAEKDNQIITKDNRFIKYKNGIVYDTKTGLEWIAGPDKFMGAFAAKKWTKQLHLDGGKWRLPLISELQSLNLEEDSLADYLPFVESSHRYIWYSDLGNCTYISNGKFGGFIEWKAGCDGTSTRFFVVRSKQ